MYRAYVKDSEENIKVINGIGYISAEHFQERLEEDGYEVISIRIWNI